MSCKRSATDVLDSIRANGSDAPRHVVAGTRPIAQSIAAGTVDGERGTAEIASSKYRRRFAEAAQGMRLPQEGHEPKSIVSTVDKHSLAAQVTTEMFLASLTPDCFETPALFAVRVLGVSVECSIPSLAALSQVELKAMSPRTELTDHLLRFEIVPRSIRTLRGKIEPLSIRACLR